MTRIHLPRDVHSTDEFLIVLLLLGPTQTWVLPEIGISGLKSYDHALVKFEVLWAPSDCMITSSRRGWARCALDLAGNSNWEITEAGKKYILSKYKGDLYDTLIAMRI